MGPTFKEYLFEARALNFNPKFEFANKQVFDADIVVPPNSPKAEGIISKIQQPKIDELAQKLNITWQILFARSFDQRDRWRGTSRRVWTYILVGSDDRGNEIAYYKYEAGPGSGQSHVYGNRKNKTKLTWILASTPEEARERLGLNRIDPSDQSPVPTNAEDLYDILRKKFKKAEFWDYDDSLIMTIPMICPRYKKEKRALSLTLKPYRDRIIAKYDVLYGAKDVNRGYRDWSRPHKLGSYTDINELIRAIKSKKKRWETR